MSRTGAQRERGRQWRWVPSPPPPHLRIHFAAPARGSPRGGLLAVYQDTFDIFLSIANNTLLWNIRWCRYKRYSTSVERSENLSKQHSIRFKGGKQTNYQTEFREHGHLLISPIALVFVALFRLSRAAWSRPVIIGVCSSVTSLPVSHPIWPSSSLSSLQIRTSDEGKLSNSSENLGALNVFRERYVYWAQRNLRVWCFKVQYWSS